MDKEISVNIINKIINQHNLNLIQNFSFQCINSNIKQKMATLSHTSKFLLFPSPALTPFPASQSNVNTSLCSAPCSRVNTKSCVENAFPTNRNSRNWTNASKSPNLNRRRSCLQKSKQKGLKSIGLKSLRTVKYSVYIKGDWRFGIFVYF